MESARESMEVRAQAAGPHYSAQVAALPTRDAPYFRPLLSQHETARALIVRARLDSRRELANRHVAI